MSETTPLTEGSGSVSDKITSPPAAQPSMHSRCSPQMKSTSAGSLAINLPPASLPSSFLLKAEVVPGGCPPRAPAPKYPTPTSHPPTPGRIKERIMPRAAAASLCFLPAASLPATNSLRSTLDARSVLEFPSRHRPATQSQQPRRVHQARLPKHPRMNEP